MLIKMLICPNKFSIDTEFPTSYIRNSTSEIHNRNVHHFIVPGVYERPLIDWAMQFIKEGTNAIDIGAHIGSWSLFMSKKARNVYAFEAQRMIYYQLCGNIAMNEINNVFCHHTGLDSESGTKTITKYGVDYGSSSFLDQVAANQKKNNVAAVGTEEISMRCLDDYELDNISFIKMDVEGMELNVLKGATKTLEKNRPVILLESWTSPEFSNLRSDLIKYIESIRYKIVVINNTDQILCEPL